MIPMKLRALEILNRTKGTRVRDWIPKVRALLFALIVVLLLLFMMLVDIKREALELIDFGDK
jgi:hypothetical protein